MNTPVPTPCRDCGHEVSRDAPGCPACGAPRPADPRWNGWGYEYRSATEVLGLPLVHVSFKFRSNRVPVPARGIIAIGQFAAGVVTVSQFGIGVVSVGQFAIAGWALAQFAAAYSLVAQAGLYYRQGYGQVVRSTCELLGYGCP